MFLSFPDASGIFINVEVVSCPPDENLLIAGDGATSEMATVLFGLALTSLVEIELFVFIEYDLVDPLHLFLFVAFVNFKDYANDGGSPLFPLVFHKHVDALTIRKHGACTMPPVALLIVFLILCIEGRPLEIVVLSWSHSVRLLVRYRLESLLVHLNKGHIRSFFVADEEHTTVAHHSHFIVFLILLPDLTFPFAILRLLLAPGKTTVV